MLKRKLQKSSQSPRQPLEQGGNGLGLKPPSQFRNKENMAVQRMLVKKSNDGGDPVLLNNVDMFRDIEPGTLIFENVVNEFVTYLGIHGEDTVFIKLDNTVYIYDVTNGNTHDYHAGTPESVTMTLMSLVNGESIDGKGKHCGVMYRFQVHWSKTGKNTGYGVMVTEVITTESSTGWFGIAPSRAQELFLVMDPGLRERDFIGISSAKTKETAYDTEDRSKELSGPSVDSNTESTQVLFQHFEFIDNDGSRKIIPNSGFRVTKEIKNGQLTIKREGAAKGNVNAGTADGQTYVLDM